MTGSGRGVRSDINVTPLVDVVLVLLIIFMVITPVLQTGIDAPVPPTKTERPGPAPVDQLVVALASDGGVVVNGERLGQDAEVRLAELLRARGAGVTFIAASGELGYERVIGFVDDCRRLGAAHIAIALLEPQL